MSSQSLVGTAPVAHFADLQARLVDYASRIGELETPNDVLDALHAVTTKSLPLCVLGAVRFPVNAADWSSIRPGKSVFLHKDVPDGWWEEYERERGANSVRSCSWLSQVLRHIPGLKLHGCSNPLALIDGLWS